MPTPGSLSPPLQRHPGDGGAAVAAADDVDEAALSLRPVDGTLEVRWPARCRLDTQPLRGPNLRPARRPRAARSTPRVSPREEFGASSTATVCTRRPSWAAQPTSTGRNPTRCSDEAFGASRRPNARSQSTFWFDTTSSTSSAGTGARDWAASSRPAVPGPSRWPPAPPTHPGPQPRSGPVRVGGVCGSPSSTARSRPPGSVEELGGYRSGQPRPSDALAAKSATAADRQRPWRTVARPDPLRWDVEANGVLRVRFRTTFVFPSGFGEHESLVAGCGRPRTGATRA